MPPKLTEGRSGPTTVTAARCTPLACPSPHGARSDALYSHPAQTRRHAEPFLEARRDRLASLLFPQGVAFVALPSDWILLRAGLLGSFKVFIKCVLTLINSVLNVILDLSFIVYP